MNEKMKRREEKKSGVEGEEHVRWGRGLGWRWGWGWG